MDTKLGWCVASHLLPDALRRVMAKSVLGMEAAGLFLMAGVDTQLQNLFQDSARLLGVYPKYYIRHTRILRKAAQYARSVLHPECPAHLAALPLFRFLETRMIEELFANGDESAKALVSLLYQPNVDDTWQNWGVLINQILGPTDAAIVENIVSAQPASFLLGFSHFLKSKGKDLISSVLCLDMYPS